MVLIQIVFKCDPTYLRHKGVPLDALGRAVALVDVESYQTIIDYVMFFTRKYECHIDLIGRRSADGFLHNDNPLVCDGDFLYDGPYRIDRNWEIMYEKWMAAGVCQLDVLIAY